MSPSRPELEREDRGKVVLLKIHGQMDAEWCDRLEAVLSMLRASPSDAVVVSFAETVFFPSYAWSVLVRAQRLLVASGKRFAVSGLHVGVKTGFEAMGGKSTFVSFDDLEAGITEFGGDAPLPKDPDAPLLRIEMPVKPPPRVSGPFRIETSQDSVGFQMRVLRRVTESEATSAPQAAQQPPPSTPRADVPAPALAGSQTSVTLGGDAELALSATWTADRDPAAAAVLVLRGTIDSNTSHVLDQALHALASESRDVILDLTRVEYISSSGWGCMLSWTHRLGDRSRTMAACGMNGGVAMSYEMLCISPRLPAAPDPRSAQQLLQHAHAA